MMDGWKKKISLSYSSVSMKGVCDDVNGSFCVRGCRALTWWIPNSLTGRLTLMNISGGTLV